MKLLFTISLGILTALSTASAAEPYCVEGNAVHESNILTTSAVLVYEDFRPEFYNRDPRAPSAVKKWRNALRNCKAHVLSKDYAAFKACHRY